MVQYNHTKNKILNEPIKFVTISQSVKFMLLSARIIMIVFSKLDVHGA